MKARDAKPGCSVPWDTVVPCAIALHGLQSRRRGKAGRSGSVGLGAFNLPDLQNFQKT